MNPVITVNLNGNAYQIEDPGYTQLRAYLDRAANALKGNPDAAEIIADLEQAIADKCQRAMGPNKTVVTAAEIAQVLEEMGPVDAGSPAAEPADAAASGDADKRKRLYQIPEGAMISGVCTGLAAYLHVDVTLIRVAFLILAYWGGAGIIAYLVLMFVIPKATTDKQVAAAHGEPFNAKEVIDHAMRISADIRAKAIPHLRNQQRHMRRQLRRARRQQAMHGAGPHGPFVIAAFMLLIFSVLSIAKSGTFWGFPIPAGIPHGVLMLGLFLACFVIFAPMGSPRASAAPSPVSAVTPVMNLLSAAWLIVLILALVSLFKTHAVFGWPIPGGVPLWAAAVGVVLVYQFVAAPLMTARGAVRADAVATMVAGGLVCWLMYENMPQFREVVQRVWERMQ